MNASKTPFLQGRSRIWLIVIILSVASLIAILLPLALLHRSLQQIDGASAATGPAPQRFSVGANAVISVKEQSGDISIYPANTNTITITPRRHGTLLAPDVHAVRILYTHTDTAQGNDQITVTTDPWVSNTDFYITVPGSTSAQIALVSGSIDVHAGHGLSASTESGGITFDTISGAVNVRTDSGDVTGNTINGPVTVAAASGSIKLQGITGQISAKTWSGDVIVHTSAISGTSLLQTVNGSVRFDGSIDPRGSYTMQTTNGDVDLSLPARSAFVLQASTVSGSVQNGFGASRVGGEPQAPLALHTQNGSVVLDKES
jgi:hypothetical protein